MYSVVYETHLRNEHYLDREYQGILFMANEGLLDTIGALAHDIWEKIIELINKFRNWFVKTFTKKEYAHIKGRKVFLEHMEILSSKLIFYTLDERGIGKDDSKVIEVFTNTGNEIKQVSNAMKVSVFEAVDSDRSRIRGKYEKVEFGSLQKINEFIEKLQKSAKKSEESFEKYKNTVSEKVRNAYLTSVHTAYSQAIKDLTECCQKIKYSGKDSMATVNESDDAAEVTIDE